MKKTAFLFAAMLIAPLAHAQSDDETPEERAYQGRMDTQLRSWIHEGNHDTTDEERTFVDEHWKRAARLWRIRKLANEARDAAAIARVDALLAKADHMLEDHIRRYREHAPVMTAAPPVFETNVPPPPPQQETQGAAVPGQTWVPGFWAWNGARHQWTAGHWTAPPQPGMTWEAPKWENRGGRWAFEEGRWRAAPAAPNVVYEPPPPPPTDEAATTPPPPPIVEVRPAPPPNGVWIPGYWHWSGSRHVWVGGRWSAPRAGMRWEPDHWVREGNRYKRVPGRWAR